MSLPDDDPVYTLKKEGLVTLEALYIDGTKMEANANRYTFVWRGTLNYHLAGLLDTIDSLYTRYNELLNENEYGQKYEPGNVQMFIIEGILHKEIKKSEGKQTENVA